MHQLLKIEKIDGLVHKISDYLQRIDYVYYLANWALD
jgi:hypothetical protein